MTHQDLYKLSFKEVYHIFLISLIVPEYSIFYMIPKDDIRIPKLDA